MCALKMSELFTTLNGESSSAGYRCLVLRLAGCDVGCEWCDTHNQNVFEFEEADLFGHVTSMGAKNVLITGGEPLAQSDINFLVSAACRIDGTQEVLVETSGCFPLSNAFSPINDGTRQKKLRFAMDIKCPGARANRRTHWSNLDLIEPKDDVKFVLASWEDYEYAKAIAQSALRKHRNTIFSPVHGQFSTTELAERILEDKLNVRLGVQLHKKCWPNLG